MICSNVSLRAIQGCGRICATMAAEQIVVTKKNNENNMGLLRRFRKKARTSGISRHLRKIRFAERSKSDLQQKKSKLTLASNLFFIY